MADQLNKDKLQQDFEQIRDERRKSANTAERIGNAFLSLLHFITEVEDRRYLSREHDDTAGGLITFAKGLVSKALAKLSSLFVSGNTQLGENGTQTTFGSYAPDASGASISVSENGTSTAEFDFLNIRRAAYFREITIKELKHVGGEMALPWSAPRSSGSMLVGVSSRQEHRPSTSVISRPQTASDIYIRSSLSETRHDASSSA